MYERNINVLEMFVEKKLGYVETNNIKNNYYDYKELVKVLAEYLNICEEQVKAKQEYDLAVANIQNIQETKEKLYNQNVKFEYSRNILFSDINRKVEDIEKCITKIEAALDKNKDTFKTLRKNFIQGIIDLNEKSRTLKKISRPKNKIETDYKDALSLIKENYHSINPADIELTKKFIDSVELFEEELIEKMMHNGRNEKIPFDKDAITEAAKLGLDIAQKEAENYLFMYEQTGKILSEIENNKLKLEARKKHITDVGVKLSFLKTEKEYLVQFLDNERVTAIQGESEHNKLMKNCCKTLKEDVAQFNILYDLIIKEGKKRATNRCYEELYNKSYLKDIQEKEKQFMEKTANINYTNGTIISPNYWRIDNIKAIYENFDKNVYETYGRKFVAPADSIEDEQPKIVERIVEKIVEKPTEKVVEKIIEKPTENITQKTVQTNQKENILTEKITKEKQASSKENLEKTIPKFKKVQRTNQIISEDNIDFSEDDYEEESMFSKPNSEDDELDDIEAIIKEAQASINSKNKKSSIIKKVMSKNKGKFVEE